MADIQEFIQKTITIFKGHIQYSDTLMEVDAHSKHDDYFAKEHIVYSRKLAEEFRVLIHDYEMIESKKIIKACLPCEQTDKKRMDNIDEVTRSFRNLIENDPIYELRNFLVMKDFKKLMEVEPIYRLKKACEEQSIKLKDKRKHRIGKKIRCPKCLFNCTTNKVLKRHMATHVSFRCSDCSRNFGRLVDLRYHKKSCKKTDADEKMSMKIVSSHGANIYKCHACSKNFNHVRYFNRHNNLVHS